MATPLEQAEQQLQHIEQRVANQLAFIAELQSKELPAALVRAQSVSAELEGALVRAKERVLAERAKI